MDYASIIRYRGARGAVDPVTPHEVSSTRPIGPVECGSLVNIRQPKAPLTYFNECAAQQRLWEEKHE